MFPPSCTQTNIHTFAPHVDTQKWTRYPHSHSPYALYTPRSRHHHPQRGSQRPIPELNPLRSGVGTGRPPRSPQQQRKSTAQTPTGRPAHPHSPRPQTENREQGCEKKKKKKRPHASPHPSNVVLVCVVLRCFKTGCFKTGEGHPPQACGQLVPSLEALNVYVQLKIEKWHWHQREGWMNRPPSGCHSVCPPPRPYMYVSCDSK